MTFAKPGAIPALILFTAAGCATTPPSPSKTTTGKSIAQTARTQLNASYTFGGNSPKQGFDCSGLAWWSHEKNAIAIPRQSYRQFKSGRRVSPQRLAAGDLVFFTTYKRGPSHVGIYLGGGRFIHAPGTGKRVRISELSNRYWKTRYLGARRYF